MHFKFETYLDFFIFFIFLIKIIFILSAIGHLVLSHSTNVVFQQNDKKLQVIKEQTEFIFIASMAVLLIYHFKPGNNKTISEETSILFFLFGCVLLLTAKWSLFFKETSWYKTIINNLR